MGTLGKPYSTYATSCKNRFLSLLFSLIFVAFTQNLMLGADNFPVKTKPTKETLAFFYLDADGDGYGDGSNAIEAETAPPGYVDNDDDCDDEDAAINPGATEVCNGTDDNCDGQIDEDVQSPFYEDLDGDGFGTIANVVFDCSVPPGYATNKDDCDDTESDVNPNATEACNEIDDDCDELIDEDVQSPFYEDLDGDGFGTTNDVVFACVRPVGYATNKDDCDDTEADVNPNATEACNEIDDDCDELIDEDVQTPYYQDLDGDGFGTTNDVIFTCIQPMGYATNKDDCNDSDADINPAAQEACDALDTDEDCDGFADNSDYLPLGQTQFYYDEDEDGYGDPNSFTYACDPVPGFVANDDDCNITNPLINPGVNEQCDALNVDEDCDGVSDNNDYFPDGQVAFYLDSDNDSYGDASMMTMACDAPVGFVLNNTDCNDNNSNVNPGEEEQCDPFNTDEDCDGVADNNDYLPLGQVAFYYDNDNDNYGDPTISTMACDAPFGYVSNNTDCNDGASNINPGVNEQCDALNVDEDCDGLSDNNDYLPSGQTAFFYDGDGDTYGDALTSTMACDAPTGFVTNDDDCNDGNAAVQPGAAESCNTIDDNCNGTIDEGTQLSFYADTDLDGFGSSTTVLACSAGPGLVTNNLDCNDNNAAVKPGGTEVCNDIDDDCDGQIDEGLKKKYYEDSDADNFGDASSFILACTPPSGYVLNKTDNCPDDYNPNQYDIDDDGDGDVCDDELDFCEAIDELIDDIEDADLSNSLENSLINKLEQALDKFEDNKYSQAISKLNSFINQVNSKKGNGIPVDLANYWIYVAQQMIAHINAGTAECEEGGGCRETASEEAQSVPALSRVYPNPVVDFVYIEHTENIQKIVVSQIHGTMAAIDISMNEDASNKALIDLSTYGLTNGMYVISVYSESGITNHSISFTRP